MSELNKKEIRSFDLASEKVVSNWLNAMTSKRYYFLLTKSEFRDGIAVRFGWDPVKMPSLWAMKTPLSHMPSTLRNEDTPT